MYASARLGLTALTAALLLASAVGTASARSLSVSNQNIRATWSSLEFVSAVTIRCQVTLEGSFHSRTIAKVARSLIGAITRATVKEETCTNGRGRPQALPYHLTYEGFTGTLPAIASVLLLLSRMRLQVTVPGLCTGEYGTGTDNVTLRAGVSGGEITSLEPIAGRSTVTRLSGGAFCPGSGVLAGSGSVTLLSSTTRIRVTLIESAPPGEIRVQPTSVNFPRGENGPRDIRVWNGALAGSQDIVILESSLRFEIGNTKFRIEPGETCQGTTLRPARANECVIRVAVEAAAVRPATGTLEFDYRTAGTVATQEIVVQAE